MNIKASIFLIVLALSGCRTKRIQSAGTHHDSLLEPTIVVNQVDWQAGDTVTGEIVFRNNGTRPAAYLYHELPYAQLVDPFGQKAPWHHHPSEGICGGCVHIVEETLGPGKSVSRSFVLPTCPSEYGGFLVRQGVYRLIVEPETQFERTRISGATQAIRFVTSSVCPAPHSSEQYLVAGGDTLFRIARRFHTTVEALVTLNRLPDPNRLSVGQSLLVPGNIEPSLHLPGNPQ